MSDSDGRVISDRGANEEIKQQSDNIDNLSEISKNSRTTFIAILLAVAYSFITIGATTDASLFSNSASSPLPIIQAQVPIVWFYYFAPIILFLLFIYFHVYLQRFWRCVAALPLRHEDGRSLDEYIYPWIISAAFLRAEIPELNGNKKFRFPLEAAISVILAWWLIPIILIVFWARYLTLHHWPGTIEHMIIIVLAVAAAIRFYCAAKNSVNSKRNNKESARYLLHPNVVSVFGALISIIFLTYISFGAIEGAPKEICKSNDIPECGLFYSGGRALQLIKYSPFADLKENEFQKPKNWWELVNDKNFKKRITELPKPDFDRKDFRFSNAKNSFLTRSSFVNARMQWINLDNAILINTDLSGAVINSGSFREADLRWSNLSDTKLRDAVLWYADLKYSHLSGADFTDSVLSKAKLIQASGVEIDFTRANMRHADLTSAQFTGAIMTNTSLQKANLTSAKLTNSTFDCANLKAATMIKSALTGATFKDTDFEKSILNHAAIDHVEFVNVDFQRSHMKSSFVRNSTFTNVKFNKAHLDSADFIGSKFLNADFSDASLDNADLSEVVFEDAVFIDADFGGADVQGTVFKNSDLSGANLFNTNGFDKVILQGSCGDKSTILPIGHSIPECEDKVKAKFELILECENNV